MYISWTSFQQLAQHKEQYNLLILLPECVTKYINVAEWPSYNGWEGQPLDSERFAFSCHFCQLPGMWYYINYIIASYITYQLPSPRKGEKYLNLPQRFLQGLNRIKTAKCLVQLPDKPINQSCSVKAKWKIMMDVLSQNQHRTDGARTLHSPNGMVFQTSINKRKGKQTKWLFV